MGDLENSDLFSYIIFICTKIIRCNENRQNTYTTIILGIETPYFSERNRAIRKDKQALFEKKWWAIGIFLKTIYYT